MLTFNDLLKLQLLDKILLSIELVLVLWLFNKNPHTENIFNRALKIPFIGNNLR